MSVNFNKIQYLCELNSITVNALEKNIGVNHGTIQKWKNKEGLMPSSAILVLIADYFNVSVDYLLDRCFNPSSHLNGVATAQADNVRIYAALTKVSEAITEAELEIKNYFKQ